LCLFEGQMSLKTERRFAALKQYDLNHWPFSSPVFKCARRHDVCIWFLMSNETLFLHFSIFSLKVRTKKNNKCPFKRMESFRAIWMIVFALSLCINNLASDALTISNQDVNYILVLPCTFNLLLYLHWYCIIAMTSILLDFQSASFV
jgi:hypothetical protein